jgi:hypothetical protein
MNIHVRKTLTHDDITIDQVEDEVQPIVEDAMQEIIRDVEEFQDSNDVEEEEDLATSNDTEEELLVELHEAEITLLGEQHEVEESELAAEHEAEEASLLKNIQLKKLLVQLPLRKFWKIGKKNWSLLLRTMTKKVSS